MINYQHSTGAVLMMTCLLAACGGDCDCENIEDRIAEIDSEISALKAPHAANHEFGGTDPINVTGLYGVLTEPQPPAAHEHNTLYYSRSEVDAQLTGKTSQNEFSALVTQTNTLSSDAIKKSAIYAETFEFTFSNNVVGSPFSGDLPDNINFNPDNDTVVPIIGVALSNFPDDTLPRFFHTCEINNTSFEVRIFNADGDEITPSVVSFNGWNNATIRIDVIWTVN
jgi:hypothetical protein